MVARVSGTLEQDGDCLYIDDGEIEYLLVFPPEAAELENGTLKFRLGNYQVGSEVQFGGGEGGGFSTIEIPESCKDVANRWIVQ